MEIDAAEGVPRQEEGGEEERRQRLGVAALKAGPTRTRLDSHRQGQLQHAAEQPHPPHGLSANMTHEQHQQGSEREVGEGYKGDRGGEALV